MLKKAFLATFFLSATILSQSVNLTGTVKDKSGGLLQNAIVTLEGRNASATTSTDGKYTITVSPVKKKNTLYINTEIVFHNNTVKLHLLRSMPVKLDLYSLNGEFITTLVNKTLSEGNHEYLLPLKSFSAKVILFRIISGSSQSVLKCVNVGNNKQRQVLKEYGLSKNAALQNSCDTLRASKAGYKTTRVAISSFNGIVNLELDTLETSTIGTGSLENGSSDRIKQYGTAQYFWGTLGTGAVEPLVKIIHAISPEAVDIEVIFNPHFVDITYGTGAIGWSPRRGHTFRDLHISDHVELAVTNGKGDSVFYGRIDLLSATTKVESGYACLGPYGGDGALYKGDSSAIISFGSSLDENINYYGYKLFENSPSTDSTYKVNTTYPNWQYYCIYRLTLDRSAFGESGYGQVRMTSVHASPGKNGAETITVTEKGAPEQGSINDPFRYLPTIVYIPHDSTTVTPPDTIPEGGVD